MSVELDMQPHSNSAQEISILIIFESTLGAKTQHFSCLVEEKFSPAWWKRNFACSAAI